MKLYPSAQSSSQKEHFVNTSKRLLENRNATFPRSALFQMKIRVFLKYFVRSCSSIIIKNFKNFCPMGTDVSWTSIGRLLDV